MGLMNAARYWLLIETTHDDNQSLWSANGFGCLTPNPVFDGHLVGDTEQRALDSVHCSVKQSKEGWPDAHTDWRNDACSEQQIAPHSAPSAPADGSPAWAVPRRF